MLRKIAIAVVGILVGAWLAIQETVPWPANPESLLEARAPLSLSGRWMGRRVHLLGLVRTERAVEGRLNGRDGVFLPVMTADETGTVPVFLPKAEAPSQDQRIAVSGRVTRAPEKVVARFGGLKFPGRICVDATAARFTWRSLAGPVAILWGAWILVRAIQRERARKREAAEEASPGAESDAQPS